MKVFYQHCHQVQIGDKCFYVVKEEDILNEENDSEKGSSTPVNMGKLKVLSV